MVKIKVYELASSDYDDCETFKPSHETEWQEISEEDYEKIKYYIESRRYNYVKYVMFKEVDINNDEKFIKGLAEKGEEIAEKIKVEKKRQEAYELKQKKATEKRLAKKGETDRKKKEKLLQKLQDELGKAPNEPVKCEGNDA